MKVFLEVFWVQIKNGNVQYRVETVPYESELSPCQLVNKLAGENYFVHSTSWRHIHQGIILTYLAYSDYVEITMPKIRIAVEKMVDHEKSQAVAEMDVLKHALRHLAFLILNKSDNCERYIDTTSVPYLEKFAPCPAGQLSETRRTAFN